MKTKLITIIVLQFFCTFIFSQQFSTKFYLIDKNGAKDTLEVGYDANATNGMDQLFNETNFNNPINNSKFQAFIIDQCWLCEQQHFFLKKQIMKPSLNWIGEGAIPIVFPYESMPVTITWDKSVFNNRERDYSIITDWLPGGWFDAGNGTVLNYLKDTGMIQLPSITSSNVLAHLKEIGYTYFNNGIQYPLRTIYLAFASKQITGVRSIKYDNRIQVSPNPVIDNINIKCTNGQSVESACVYSIDGKVLKSVEGPVNNIDCSELKKGLYFLSVRFSGLIENIKFIKQ